MIEDARRLEPGTRLAADVAIIGSGAAGVALALALARKSPRARVLLLEAGGKNHDIKEQSRHFAGEVSDPRHPPLNLYRRRMLGGTTSVWGGRCIAMEPDDFAARPDLGRPGWPVSYPDIARYYARALELLEAGACAFDAAQALPDAPPGMGPVRPGTGLVVDRVERFSPPTNLGTRYAGELEAAPNIRVLLNAPCVEIVTTGSGGKVQGLVLRAGGNLLQAAARNIVIAAGGLETPRLMLWSARAGRGWISPHLGRHYMTHYTGDLGHIRFAHPPERLQLGYAMSHDGIWCRRLLQLDQRTRRENGLVNFVLRPSIGAIHDPAHGNSILSAAFLTKRFLIPEYARRLASMPAEPGASAMPPVALHLRNLATGMPGLLKFTGNWTRQRILPRRKLPSLFLPRANGVYPLEFNAEQIADPRSAVALSRERDPNGVPLLSVNWRMAPDFPERLLGIYDVMGRCLRASGLGEIVLTGAERNLAPERCQSQGGHHMGTARMSSAPGEGVVDPDLQVWGTPGLYVLGSAVFPTCGFANPTLTIVALALRLADRLAAAPAAGRTRAATGQGSAASQKAARAPVTAS